MEKAPSATTAWKREQQQESKLWVVLAGTDPQAIDALMGKLQTFLAWKETPPIAYLRHPLIPGPTDRAKITMALRDPGQKILISGSHLPQNTPNKNFVPPLTPRKAPRQPNLVIWLASPEEASPPYNTAENLCTAQKIPFHTAPRAPGKITSEAMFSEALALLNDAFSHTLQHPLFRYPDKRSPHAHTQMPSPIIFPAASAKEGQETLYAPS